MREFWFNDFTLFVLERSAEFGKPFVNGSAAFADEFRLVQIEIDDQVWVHIDVAILVFVSEDS